MASPVPSAQSIHIGMQVPPFRDNPSDERRESLTNEYRYIGEYNATNQRHGFGRAFFKTGDSYEGYYENGKRHGHGMYKFLNGAVYDGQWVNGMKNGLGVFTYPDGSKYEGNWLDDQRSEHGVYTYVNGDKYDGHWRYHVRHGSGRYIYTHAGLQYQGTWNDGKREGIGHLLEYNTKTEEKGSHASTDSIEPEPETEEQHEKHEHEHRRQSDHFHEQDKRYGHEVEVPDGEGSRPTSEAGSTKDGPAEERTAEEIHKDVLVPGGEGTTEGEGRAEWWDAQKPSQKEEVSVPGSEAVTEAEGRAAWWEAQGQRQLERMESQLDAHSQHDAQSQHGSEGHHSVQGHEHGSEGHEGEGQKDEHVTEGHDHQSHSQQDLTEGNKNQNGQQNEGDKDQTEGHRNEGGDPHSEGMHLEGHPNCDAKGCSIKSKCPFPLKDEGSFYDLLSSSFTGGVKGDDDPNPTKDPAGEGATTDQIEELPKDVPDATELGDDLKPLEEIPRIDSEDSEHEKQD